jgi:hypothetical protein
MSKKYYTLRYALSLLSVLLIIGTASCKKKDSMAEFDSRKPIELTPEQRSYFLSEMREMMFSMNGTLAGLYSGQSVIATESARKSGASFVTNIGDMPKDLNERLPAEFKNFRAATHMNFDELADLIEKKKDNKEILGKLTNLTGNCASCHAMYRIVSK